jgi:hypothetical protein
MALHVQFFGGPADGIEHDYPALEVALPSLYWHDDARALGGVYRRDDAGSRPEDGDSWRYAFTGRS